MVHIYGNMKRMQINFVLVFVCDQCTVFNQLLQPGQLKYFMYHSCKMIHLKTNNSFCFFCNEFISLKAYYKMRKYKSKKKRKTFQNCLLKVVFLLQKNCISRENAKFIKNASSNNLVFVCCLQPEMALTSPEL